MKYTEAKHWRTKWAVGFLCKQLQNDLGFRESWHANIAMPIYDEFRKETACEVIGETNIKLANRIADRLMNHLFGA